MLHFYCVLSWFDCNISQYVKGHPVTCRCRYRREAKVELQTTRNPVLEKGKWLAPRFGRFTPGSDPVPIVEEEAG